MYRLSVTPNAVRDKGFQISVGNERKERQKKGAERKRETEIERKRE
jgi:hypothetical protein